MKILRTAICTGLVAASLAACAKEPDQGGTEAKLKQLTLEATGAAAAQSVTVSEVQATASKRIWTATVDGKTYSCDADTFFRLPACEPAAQPGA